MRSFVFVKKDDATKKATIKVDMVDNKFEIMTIMQYFHVVGTEFEKIFPWKEGSVVSMTEIREFCESWQGEYDCYLYGGQNVVTLGAPVYELTITATITGGDTAKATLKGTKSGAVSTSQEIEFTTAVAKKVPGIEGYSYSFELGEGVEWTSGTAPEAFVCDGDETVALALTIPGENDNTPADDNTPANDTPDTPADDNDQQG